jgi:hypothetical protein
MEILPRDVKREYYLLDYGRWCLALWAFSVFCPNCGWIAVC